MIALAAAARDWRPIIIRHLGAFSSARQQCHHAARVANAPALSYLPASADGANAAFTWNPRLEAFTSPALGFRMPLSFAWRPRELSLLALDGTGGISDALPLSGRTMAEAHEWAKARCVGAGGDAAKYTTAKPYSLPGAAMADGAKFGAEADALGALGTLWGNSLALLEGIARAPGATPIRLWPEQLNAGLRLVVDPARSIDCGFSAGDRYYEEPHWYAIPNPRPDEPRPPVLSRGAHWHDVDFFAAILPWSSWANSPAQGTEVSTFLLSALANCRTLLGK